MIIVNTATKPLNKRFGDGITDQEPIIFTIHKDDSTESNPKIISAVVKTAGSIIIQNNKVTIQTDDFRRKKEVEMQTVKKAMCAINCLANIKSSPGIIAVSIVVPINNDTDIRSVTI